MVLQPGGLAAQVRRCYFRPWLSCCPVIGSVAQADCTRGYSFGRNSFPDSELGQILWKILEKVEYNQADAFNLLHLREFDPGAQNEELARAAITLAEDAEKQGRRLILINQWEINYCIWVNYRQWYSQHHESVVSLWAPRHKNYYNSVDVTVDAIRATRVRGLAHPAILAHDAHRVRTLAINWKLNEDPIVPFQKIQGFDHKSVQSGPSSKLNWHSREILARVHHLVFGHVSLSRPV